MKQVHINEPQFRVIQLIRAALSENSTDQRLEAIKNVKQDRVSDLLEQLPANEQYDWTADPLNGDLVRWAAKTSAKRSEASYEVSRMIQRYEKIKERRLNVAEQIGMQVWLSITNEKFEGVHSPGGIFEQISDEARRSNVYGAKDMDTIREIWNMYRGVVHLGMALDHCEDYPEQNWHVLHLAEVFRKGLSEFCPRGTSEPYVDSSQQISFLYISSIYGPRFRNRGLPFNTD
jgi:hypothetical protein